MASDNSGSTASVIHPDVLSKVSWIADVHREHQTGQLRLADGDVVNTQGSVKLLLKLGTDSVPIQHDCIVAAVEAPAVVGLDFMWAHGCILNVPEGTLVVEDKVHVCRTMQHLPSCFRIAMAETIIVPPYSEMVIPGVVQGQAHFTEGVIEIIEFHLCDGHVALAKLVVNPAGGDVPLHVVNMGYQSAKLHEGMIIASCEPAQVMSMVEEESSDNNLNSDIVKVEHDCLLTWVLFLMSMNIASVTQRYVSLEKCWKRSWWHLLNPKMILVPLMLLYTGWKWFLPKQAKRVLGGCLFPSIRLSRMNLVACRDWVSSSLPTARGHLPLSL